MTLTGRHPHPRWDVRGRPALTLRARAGRPRHPPRMGGRLVNSFPILFTSRNYESSPSKTIAGHVTHCNAVTHGLRMY